MRPVDIVIPVFRGYRETVACLESVLATIDRAWARPVVVNDASPEPEITAWLRDLTAREPAVVLLENPENRGFVATANRGMAHGPERDVLLLNSDVEVANDWLQRIRAAARRHPDAGSFTPFSNNATICSFPDFCHDNRLPFGLGLADIDALFAREFTADDVFRLPTGVGCCMYLRREALDAVGLFDEATFGRGYGEENDWCQRAACAGWHNYQLANCFVYHRGGVSFGQEQNPRVARALELLDRRYPRYHREVQDHIAADPAKAARTRALLGLFANLERPKVLCISHKLGGGAQQHIDELAALYGGEALFAQLTPEREGESVALSFFDGGERLADALYFEVDREYDRLLELLRALGIGRLHFHHTMGVPTRLWRLAADLGCGCDLTVHDYFLVNGNPTLTDTDAGFVGDDAPDLDARCAGHYPLPPGVTGQSWRENQKLLVEGADRVIFPSADSRRRFTRFFKPRQGVVAWHPDYAASQPYPAPRWQPPQNRPLRVLVLGAISREKGADTLEAVARELAGEAVEFHLLGYAYRALDRAVITHGPYDNARVHELVAGIAPDLAWFPARWPETYSYTLSVALHNALPVVVPDVGAFVERVAGRNHSVVCRWDNSVAQWCGFWRDVLRQGALPTGLPAGETGERDTAFYRGAYLAATPARAGTREPGAFAALEDNLHAHTRDLTRSERLLSRLWRLSRRPAVARLVSIVPFRVQRLVKRRFSRRPMHDIVGGQG